MREGYSKALWSNLWSNLKWNLYLTIFAWFIFIPVRDAMNQKKSEGGDFLKIIVHTQARATRKNILKDQLAQDQNQEHNKVKNIKL